jgi:glycosyltransferase involved in cell wall biosynthesis
MNNSMPKVSYILLAFNQDRFIEDAVKSALNQNYENIEFILSDDCSSDSTWEKIKLLAKNTKRSVTLNQMPKNSGLVSHLNFCLSICSGDIIVTHAGDDIALKDRVHKSVQCFMENPNAFSVTFNDTTIDSEGNILCDNAALSYSGFFDLNTALESTNVLFSGASRAIRREVYDIFGPLQKECSTEDTPFFLRALYLGGCVLSDDAGILYRKTDTSLSSEMGMKTHNPMNIIRQYEADFEIANLQGMLTNSDNKNVQSWMAFKNIQKKYSQTESFFNKVIYLLISLFKNKYFRKYIWHMVIK